MRRYPSEGEKRVHKLLGKLNVQFTFQRGFMTQQSFYIVDFFLAREKLINLALEVDGMQHQEQSARKYDKVRDAYIRIYKGCNTVRISHQYALNITIDQLKQVIGWPNVNFGKHRGNILKVKPMNIKGKTPVKPSCLNAPRLKLIKASHNRVKMGET